MTRQGVHRRALAVAVRNAAWIDREGADAANLQVARELADRLDAMRTDRTLFGDARTNWHSANVAAKYLDALRSLRLTNADRPDDETEGESLGATLRAIVAGDAES